ncbi:TPA: HNH endonuclease [Vibrio parahaemolyticus]|uniref:HNH endonuclease signature motif containing protein n=1 Tax=Vibrio parahaemolyticus TaxID=670 RepID=UPI003B003038|nr:HNH endonuclease [Vibrio parahaemolyticus]HCM1516432.1 HNH endonuclease [Vibrio parahaemolyticus]
MRKVCASAGCRNITTKRHCTSCQAVIDKRSKEYAKKRARKSSARYEDKYKSFYGSPEWRSLRDKKLRKDPLCEDCKDNGFIREGKDVDHVIEIKDDWSLRLDITNLRTLCRSCHMRKTARERTNRRNESVGRMNRWG